MCGEICGEIDDAPLVATMLDADAGPERQHLIRAVLDRMAPCQCCDGRCR